MSLFCVSRVLCDDAQGLLRATLNHQFGINLPPAEGPGASYPPIKSKNEGPRVPKASEALKPDAEQQLGPGLHFKLVSAQVGEVPE